MENSIKKIGSIKDRIAELGLSITAKQLEVTQLQIEAVDANKELVHEELKLVKVQNLLTEAEKQGGVFIEDSQQPSQEITATDALRLLMSSLTSNAADQKSLSLGMDLLSKIGAESSHPRPSTAEPSTKKGRMAPFARRQASQSDSVVSQDPYTVPASNVAWGTRTC